MHVMFIHPNFPAQLGQIAAHLATELKWPTTFVTSVDPLHLHACDAAYTPTQFQLSTAPAELQHKLRVIFDGVDTDLFQRREVPRPVEFRGLKIDADTRVVTYVSRGLESARGFDIFMKAA